MVGLRARCRRALPARILRRPAPAHRHRPRARAVAEAAGGRRAGLRARRVHPVADHQPHRGAAAQARPVHAVHQPRPVGHQACERSHRGDVSGADRRDRRGRRHFREPAAPLYAGADLRRADAARPAQARAHRAGGRPSRPLRPAARLRVPWPLPPRHAALLGGPAGARPARGADAVAEMPSRSTPAISTSRYEHIP